MKKFYIIFATFIAFMCIYTAVLKSGFALPNLPKSASCADIIVVENSDDDTTSDLDETKFA